MKIKIAFLTSKSLTKPTTQSRKISNKAHNLFVSLKKAFYRNWKSLPKNFHPHICFNPSSANRWKLFLRIEKAKNCKRKINLTEFIKTKSQNFLECVKSEVLWGAIVMWLKVKIEKQYRFIWYTLREWNDKHWKKLFYMFERVPKFKSWILGYAYGNYWYVFDFL